MGKSKEKVYCGTCKWLGGSYRTNTYICSHINNKTTIDTPLETKVEYKAIEDANAKNDCKLYEKDRTPEVLAEFDRIDGYKTCEHYELWDGLTCAPRIYAMPNGEDYVYISYSGHRSLGTKEEFLDAKAKALKAELKTCKDASEQTTEKSLDERKCWPLFWRKR